MVKRRVCLHISKLGAKSLGECMTADPDDVPGADELCSQCGHLFNPHRLLGYGDPPTEGWMEGPVEGCECRMTWDMAPDVSDNIKATFKTARSLSSRRSPCFACILGTSCAPPGWGEVVHRVTFSGLLSLVLGPILSKQLECGAASHMGPAQATRRKSTCGLAAIDPSGFVSRPDCVRRVRRVQVNP